MNNYKEVSILISCLFVIYFFKDMLTTLIMLVILSMISILLIKSDYSKEFDEENFSPSPSITKEPLSDDFIYINAK